MGGEKVSRQRRSTNKRKLKGMYCPFRFIAESVFVSGVWKVEVRCALLQHNHILSRTTFDLYAENRQAPMCEPIIDDLKLMLKVNGSSIRIYEFIRNTRSTSRYTYQLCSFMVMDSFGSDQFVQHSESAFEEQSVLVKKLSCKGGTKSFWEYFQSNWVASKEMWVRYYSNMHPHFRNTNNRLESNFGKIKLDLDGASTMKECLESLLRFNTRCENEYHASILSSFESGDANLLSIGCENVGAGIFVCHATRGVTVCMYSSTLALQSVRQVVLPFSSAKFNYSKTTKLQECYEMTTALPSRQKYSAARGILDPIAQTLSDLTMLLENYGQDMKNGRTHSTSDVQSTVQLATQPGRPPETDLESPLGAEPIRKLREDTHTDDHREDRRGDCDDDYRAQRKLSLTKSFVVTRKRFPGTTKIRFCAVRFKEKLGRPKITPKARSILEARIENYPHSQLSSMQAVWTLLHTANEGKACVKWLKITFPGLLEAKLLLTVRILVQIPFCYPLLRLEVE
ncbi:hypothetical protein JG687_00011827 [Phytophthora cactorum]|uniref:MULE transposase domain-containing protein n=1 Tax=Phytophthora cactorum TaxID=29920 RepID=A0A8T1U8N8_9STRA|nr:hypothetical protein JG687_00011827 [Phytophthora cactorum]